MKSRDGDASLWLIQHFLKPGGGMAKDVVWQHEVTGSEALPAGRVCRSWRAQLMRRPIVSVMGSDVHIRAMWVRAPDDQPAACICSACLICCSSTRRDSLIDPDIHWAHITISPHAQERKHTQHEDRALHLRHSSDSKVVMLLERMKVSCLLII